MSVSLVFFGSGPVAAKSLELLTEWVEIEAIITKPIPPHHKDNAPVEEYAKNHGLRLLFADNKQELDNLFEKEKFASQIGLIVDYGVIVSQKVIGAFKLGIINSHFSLLPQWRGADPITSAILSGQTKTGVSLMLVEPSLDTGKLITYKSLKINPTDTTQSLTERLIVLSNKILQDYLSRYIRGEIKPKRQPHPNRATYSKKISKKDGEINWHKSAEQIEREIRAYIGWPGSYFNLKNIQLTITKASAVSTKLKPGEIKIVDDKKGLLVGCLVGSINILELKPAGKKNMSAKDFINGYRNLLL